MIPTYPIHNNAPTWYFGLNNALSEFEQFEVRILQLTDTKISIQSRTYPADHLIEEYYQFPILMRHSPLNEENVLALNALLLTPFKSPEKELIKCFDFLGVLMSSVWISMLLCSDPIDYHRCCTLSIFR
eukprot:GHVH01013744.1.p1 GENE.GHVH01013744.1~~GHVH01013744.1.p1  ORF type:complete len:129 (-),score=5.60 GHVH01013744.1:540-926(-)